MRRRSLRRRIDHYGPIAVIVLAVLVLVGVGLYALLTELERLGATR